MKASKPLVRSNGAPPKVEDNAHPHDYSGSLQDQVTGKPLVDDPKFRKTSIGQVKLPKNFMKQAFERGFIKAAIDNGVKPVDAVKLLNKV